MGAKYEPALDGLRAVAVMMVLLFHSSVPYAGGGIRGVDVFFVLSGYLITSLLRGGGAWDLKGFWARRLLRLYPALALFLLVYVLAAPYLLPPKQSEGRVFDAAVSLFYVADHAGGANLMRGLGHMWSLSVEMQFYLLWPFAVRWLSRFEDRTAWKILLAAWAAVTLARTATFLITENFPGTYAPSYFHCTGLILGASLTYVRWPARFGWLGVFVLADLFLFSFKHDVEGGMAWRITAAELASSAIISALLEPGTRLQRALAWPPLVRLGVLSYGIYLWHHPFTQMLKFQPWPLVMGVTLIGAIGGAWVSYETVERLGRNWRKRVSRSDPRAPALAAAE